MPSVHFIKHPDSKILYAVQRMILFHALLAALPKPSCAAVRVATSKDFRPHTAYVEALGRGGLWGLGYDYYFGERVALGGTTSYYQIDGQRFFSLAPYLSFYPVQQGKHRMLLQAGPQMLRKTVISPVPEWSGKTTLGFTATVAVGYEYRSDFLVRVYGMAAWGSEGLTPWLGASFGVTF